MSALTNVLSSCLCLAQHLNEQLTVHIQSVIVLHCVLLSGAVRPTLCRRLLRTCVSDTGVGLLLYQLLFESIKCRDVASGRARGPDPPAGPQATRDIRVNPARNALGWNECPVDRGDFCVIRIHSMLSAYESTYNPVLHSDGRSGRQRLPTVDSRHVVWSPISETRHRQPCPTTWGSLNTTLHQPASEAGWCRSTF